MGTPAPHGGYDDEFMAHVGSGAPFSRKHESASPINIWVAVQVLQPAVELIAQSLCFKGPLGTLSLRTKHTHSLGESTAGCTFTCSWQRCGCSFWWLPPSMPHHSHHMKAFPRINAPQLPASLPPPPSSSWLRSDGCSLIVTFLEGKTPPETT